MFVHGARATGIRYKCNSTLANWTPARTFSDFTIFRQFLIFLWESNRRTWDLLESFVEFNSGLNSQQQMRLADMAMVSCIRTAMVRKATGHHSIGGGT